MRKLLTAIVVLFLLPGWCVAAANRPAPPKNPARDAFSKATEKARDDGKLGVLDIIRCRSAARHWDAPLKDAPETTVGEAITDEMLHQAVKAGVLKPEALEDVSTINWDAIAKFLQTIMPLILAFISALIPLFSWNSIVPAVMVACCLPVMWFRRRRRGG